MLWVSHLPKPLHRVGVKQGVVTKKGYFFAEGLGNEQAVKGGHDDERVIVIADINEELQWAREVYHSQLTAVGPTGQMAHPLSIYPSPF